MRCSAAILILSIAGACLAERIPSDEAFSASSSVQDDDFYKQDVGDPKKLRVIIGDGTGWVNPHNMFSYSGSGKVIRQDDTPVDSGDEGPISEDTVTAEEKALLRSRKVWKEPKLSTAQPPAERFVEQPPISCDPCDCKCRELKEDLEKCRSDLQRIRLRAVLSDVESSKSSAGCEKDRQFVYLRRLALNLVYNAKFGRRNVPSKVKLSILLSAEEISTLERLAQESESQASELESHLSAVFASSTVIPQGELPNSAGKGALASAARAWANLVGSARAEWAVPSLALLGVLLFAALRGASWRIVFISVFFYLLFASFVWHWVHTYKVAEAHREAFLSQNVAAASHCSPLYSPGILERVWDFMTLQRVDCQQYYEEIHVDPIWRVSPTMVASELIWRVVLHPLTFAGKYLGLFTEDLVSRLSWWSLLTACIVFPVVLFVLAALFCGYTVVFPFGLGALRPPTAGPRVVRGPEKVPRIRSGSGGERKSPPPAAVRNKEELGREESKEEVWTRPETSSAGYVEELSEKVIHTDEESSEGERGDDSDGPRSTAPPLGAAERLAEDLSSRSLRQVLHEFHLKRSGDT